MQKPTRRRALNKVLILFIGLALFCIIQFTSKKNNASQKPSSFKQTEGLQNPQHQSSDPEQHNLNTRKASAIAAIQPKNKENNNKLSFEQRAADVRNLIEKLPATKSKLIEIIIAKAPLKKADPHTAEELRQRKLGAIKVFALRSLFEKEHERKVIKKDLISIINKAKDPTIKSIAKAALKSFNEGRSLFDDFTEAISQQ